MSNPKVKRMVNVITSISYEYYALRNEDVKNGVNMSGQESNVKYVIRLKNRVHVRSIRQRDLNATLKVTDGQRFVSPIAKRVHKGYKFFTDVLRGCSVRSVQLKGLLRYIAAPPRYFALLMSQQELLVDNIKVNIEEKQWYFFWTGLMCLKKGLAFLVTTDRSSGFINRRD